MFKKISIALALAAISSSAMAVDYMDASWAKQACDSWNLNPTLTTKLSDWIKNDKKRGYKLVQMYRTQCGEKSKVQLTIANKDGKAMCIYGGKPDGKKLDYSVDYVMHATDKNWECMGKGSWGCGAMGAMASQKLKFNGPKMEAMGVMGPFGQFLRLAGTIPGNKNARPK